MSFSLKQSASIVLGAVFILAGVAWIGGSDAGNRIDRAPRNVADPGAKPEDGAAGGNAVAGLGIVEPASGTINLSPMMPGVIVTITKAEGEPVKRGEILAELVNDDLKALVAQAESSVRLEAARLALIENGPRAEEIEQAQAKVREEQSNLKLFETQLQRHESLVRQGAVARATLNETQRSLTTSQQRLDAAMKQRDILRHGSRPEEVEAGRASLKLAQDKLAEARATLNKSYVRSTVDGIVLRRFLEPGEAVSTEPTAIIMQVADTLRLVVRTQIDENDISGLKIGQTAEISAPSLRGRALTGTVARISPRLGAKTVTAETPNEKRDTRVLDVIVALEPGISIPVNLRVDVVIDLDSGAKPSAQTDMLAAPLRLAFSEDGCSTTGCPGAADVFEGQMRGTTAP